MDEGAGRQGRNGATGWIAAAAAALAAGWPAGVAAQQLNGFYVTPVGSQYAIEANVDCREPGGPRSDRVSSGIGAPSVFFAQALISCLNRSLPVEATSLYQAEGLAAPARALNGAPAYRMTLNTSAQGWSEGLTTWNAAFARDYGVASHWRITNRGNVPIGVKVEVEFDTQGTPGGAVGISISKDGGSEVYAPPVTGRIGNNYARPAYFCIGARASTLVSLRDDLRQAATGFYGQRDYAPAWLHQSITVSDAVTPVWCTGVTGPWPSPGYGGPPILR